MKFIPLSSFLFSWKKTEQVNTSTVFQVIKCYGKNGKERQEVKGVRYWLFQSGQRKLPRGNRSSMVEESIRAEGKASWMYAWCIQGKARGLVWLE